jgi:hypothetical protein
VTFVTEPARECTPREPCLFLRRRRRRGQRALSARMLEKKCSLTMVFPKGRICFAQLLHADAILCDVSLVSPVRKEIQKTNPDLAAQAAVGTPGWTFRLCEPGTDMCLTLFRPCAFKIPYAQLPFAYMVFKIVVRRDSLQVVRSIKQVQCWWIRCDKDKMSNFEQKIRCERTPESSKVLLLSSEG